LRAAAATGFILALWNFSARRPPFFPRDLFTGLKKEASWWTRFFGLGLRRVYIGLETGHAPLLPLGREDLVYLSPFQETPGTPYAALGLEPLPDVEAELALWAEAIRKMGLKAARYDIREFVY
jgi:hypothetical protein